MKKQLVLPPFPIKSISLILHRDGSLSLVIDYW